MKKAKASKPAQPQAQISIADNTVLISLDFQSFGIMRTISSADVIDTAQTDADMIKAQKRLLDCAEYKAIKTCDNGIKNYLASRALPSFFKSGTFLLPLALVDEVDSVLTDWSTMRREMVDAFAVVYEAEKEKAKAKLGPRFNEQDYPSVSAIRGYFAFKWAYVSLATPRTLEGISAEIFEREKEKAAAQWTEAVTEVRQLLRGQLLEMVAHMQDRLTPGEDGKRKVFHASLIEKMGDFLEVFDARNVTHDAQLKSLVDRARALTEGLDPEILKDNERIRNRVAQGMAEIKEQLGTMIVEAPTRAIATDVNVDL